MIMAKATNNITTSWLWLCDARQRALKHYQSATFTERRIVEWLNARKIRCDGMGVEGSKQNSDPGPGDPTFWQEPDQTSSGATGLRINWDESSVWRRSYTANRSYTVYGIKLAEDDLHKLLPPDDSVGTSPKTPKEWIVAEVERLKATGQINSLMGITAVARLLETRMRDAPASIKRLKWTTIRNRLHDWDYFTSIRPKH
jgi:hypothetical protein